jgi:uncharacterized membrane protein
MAYLLALSSAVLYGAADFIGGLTSRRADTIAVVVVSQFTGLLLLALIVPLLPAVAPAGRDLLWGASAGVAGSIGVALLYRGLAIGTMAIVAPTTAVCAVALPVAAGVAMGERLSTMSGIGIVLALIGIILVAQETRTDSAPVAAVSDDALAWEGVAEADGAEDVSAEAMPPERAASRRWIPPGFGLAFLAGIAIGGFYLSLARASPDAGLWPLLVARCASVALFGIIAMVAGRSLRMPVGAAAMAVTAGVIDMLANALYLIATWSGALSLVVTLASLYPASTVLLARVFLHERLNRWQIAGVVCALVAVVTIVSA